MADKDRNRRREIIQASEYIAEVLTRYAKTEVYCYLKDLETSQRKPLEQALVKVYTAVLKYIAAVKSAVDESVPGELLVDLKKPHLKQLAD